MLVIIGLLAGSIVAGQSLIRAAELRNVTIEQEQFKAAVKAFDDLYHAIPGDMPNAEQVWGTNCSSSVTPAPSACNGDGDLLVNPWSYTQPYPTCGSGSKTGVNHESFQFWKQLANAKLITGNYIGVAHGSGYDWNGMIRSPGSSASEDLMWIAYDMHPCDDIGWERPDQGGAFMLVAKDGYTGTGANHMASLSLSADDVWSIDNKIDDGKPATGNMRVLSVSYTGEEDELGDDVPVYCADTDDITDYDTAQYNLDPDDDEAVRCVPYFPNAF